MKLAKNFWGMSKLFKVSMLFLLLTSVCNGYAQSIMFGVGGTYGTDIQQSAPNFRLYYGLNEHICFGPEYSYFPTKSHHNSDVQLSEYGFVAHYIFEVAEKAGLYPLVGLNYSVEKESHQEESITHDAFGASVGLGFHLMVKNVLPFAEYKFITGPLSQSTFSIGLIYHLSLGEKEH
jgi:hypothetical protein